MTKDEIDASGAPHSGIRPGKTTACNEGGAGIREWTAYCNEDGEPWAIFIHGHVDLRTIKSLACKQEMKEAFERTCGDADDFFHGNLCVGHWWIRSEYDGQNEDANPDYPWHFCKKGDDGAIPITGAKFT